MPWPLRKKTQNQTSELMIIDEDIGLGCCSILPLLVVGPRLENLIISTFYRFLWIRKPVRNGTR
ncbi:unnamed protein product, partial [Larinioides sclopetarius]